MIKATLEDVCSIQSGGTPSRGTDSYWGGSIPWAKISDLEASGDGYISDTEEHISEEGLEAIRGRIFDDGTLLFAMYGSVGKAAMVRGSVSTNQAILGIKPDASRLDLSYLKFWLRSQQHKFDQDAQGVAQKNLSAGYVRSLEIPLPPLPEQKRIAAILDKADAIRRKRQQAIQLADDFLRAVFLDMFGDPVTNPKGWGLRKLSEVCRQITVGVVVKPASYYVESGVPAIRSLNIKDYGISRENFVFFSNEDNETTLSKSRVYAGDLVIVRSGQPGKAAVITKDLDGVNAIDVLIARPDSGYINSDYLAYFFNSGAAKSIVLAEGRGQIQQHLNVGSLNAAEIPIPPLELQREFADILEKVKDKYLCSDEATYGDVFNSISQRAFSGQL